MRVLHIAPLQSQCLAMALARFPTGWNRPVDKNSRQFKILEHVLIEKVIQLFRNMLYYLIQSGYEQICNLTFRPSG